VNWKGFGRKPLKDKHFRTYLENYKEPEVRIANAPVNI